MNVFRLSVAALSVAGLALAATAADAQNRLISLAVGSSTVVTAPAMIRVAVGDGSIAGVVCAGSQLVINAKSPGRTTVAVWVRDGGRQDYDVIVTDPGIDTIEQIVRRGLNQPSLVVSQAPGALLVTGSVADTTQQTRVNDVLSRFDAFAKDRKVTIVNAVTVADPLGDVRRAMASDPALNRIRVEGDGKGNVVVSGSVHDRTAAELALGRVKSYSGPYLSADGKIIDRIATETTTQIAIKVSILEIDRTGLRQLGVRLQGATPDPNNPGSYVLGNPNIVAIEGANNTGGTALQIAPFFRLTRLAPTLDLIIQSGHARVLSSPDLVTSPGQAATFLVGGEVPYAISSGLGQTTIVFKEYGVKLDMTPTLLPDGTIETKIAPEVSDLDFADGITLNGFVVPALKTSKLSTDVVTHDGDSVIMGGLLRRIESKNITKIPILGDLPVLGKLFRSVQYQRTDTDVVFVMTPDVIVR